MRRLFAWSCAIAVVLVSAASAGAATVPLAKARTIAARKLFAYVLPLSYVTDYAVTSCSRTTGGAAACTYRVAFNGGSPCTGTILVGRSGRSVSSRFTGGLCTPPDTLSTTDPAPSDPTQPVTTSTVTTPTDPATSAPPTTTPPAQTTSTTSSTSPPPAYAGLGTTHALDSVTGSVVQLDDGSSWQVSGDVSAWIYEDVIEVAYANGAYTLTDDNVSQLPVSASYLGS